MGNSGSIQSIPSEFDDLHPYLQYNQGRRLEHKTLKWTQSYPDENYIQKQQQEHLKVLPDLNEETRLRCTTNGTILQSGGTISYRRDSPAPLPHLQRSRTSIHYDLSRKTNLSELNKSQFKINLVQDYKPKDTLYKRFGSEPDLRDQNNHENIGANQLRISKSQMVKNKKKKATPCVLQDSQSSNKQSTVGNIISDNSQQKRLRLFKTKAESKKPSIQHKVATEASDLHFKHSKLSQINQRIAEPSLSVQRTSLKSNETKIVTTPNNWQQSKIKVLPFPPMRREKSFDISLLARQNIAVAESNNENSQDRNEILGSPDCTLIYNKSHQDTFRISEEIQRKSATKSQLTTRKYSYPAQSECTSFKKELEEATKRRSLIVENVKKIDPPKTKDKKDKKPDNVIHKGVGKINPNVEDAKNNLKSVSINTKLKQSSESKIPQLTKTFYFGMEDKNQTFNKNQSDGFGKIQIDVIGEFSKSIIKEPMEKFTGSESSESALSSEEGYLMTKITEPCEKNSDGGIHVHVRPTLPRRQLEIPRFSPAIAWRTLNGEQKDIIFFGRNSGQNLDEITETKQPLEERIQRIYREPNPIYVDNKSGDSGISGDAGLPERTESPRQNFMGMHETEDSNEANTTIKPWVPQQDLDEETSSDDEEVQIGGVHKYINQSHAFSLSLPRDSHLKLSEEKEKVDFSSLQKLKKTVSNVFFGTQDRAPNYCSDNWFLSRSAPNSIENQVILGNHNYFVQDKESLDQRINTKPSSFNYFSGRKHVIYLPNHSFNDSAGAAHHVKNSSKSSCRKYSKNNKSSEYRSKERTIVQSTSSNIKDEPEFPMPLNSSKTQAHRFAFQSTIRQNERRRLAEKLSKEAEEKEAQRLNELEAMKKVEEEFQRKRAREKASIRHQLHLFSLEENQCVSLPADWEMVGYKHQRAEPDGAPSPTSPELLGSVLYNKQEKQEDVKGRQAPATQILSEFCTSRREYVEYRKDRKLDSHVDRKPKHTPVVYEIPSRSSEVVNTCDIDDDYFKSTPVLHNYRPDFAKGRSSSDSEFSISSDGEEEEIQAQYRYRSPSPSI